MSECADPALCWWVQVDKLYCLAIVHARNVRSLRDLRAEHLPLLRNILAKGSKAIQDEYGVPPAHLRAFVHYLPSYFHLHVHFMHMSKEATFGMATGALRPHFRCSTALRGADAHYACVDVVRHL